MEENKQIQKIGRSQWLTQQLMQIQAKKESVAYFYLILTFFAVAFFGFFALRPAISTISNLQKQLQDSKDVYAALQKKLDAIQSLDRQYATLEPQLPLVYDAIPVSSEIPLLTRQVQTLAEQNNVVISQFSTSPIEYYPLAQGNKLYGYTFSVTADGTNENINNFITTITNFSRMISVEKISTGKTDQGQLELSLSGKAYFQTK